MASLAWVELGCRSNANVRFLNDSMSSLLRSHLEDCMLAIGQSVDFDQLAVRGLDRLYVLGLRDERGMSLASAQVVRTTRVRVVPVVPVAGHRQPLAAELDAADFEQLAAQASSGSPAFVLLSGPSGSGKTWLAKKLIELRFTGVGRYVAAADLFASSEGQSEHNVYELFAEYFTQPPRSRPRLLVIDGLDLIAGHGRSSARIERRTQATLALCLDRLRALAAAVVVVGICADASQVADALRRPGRFDDAASVRLTPPDVAQRQRIVERLLSDVVAEPTLRRSIGGYVAERTPGFVFADLQKLVLEAAAAAQQQQRRPVDDTGLTLADFQSVLARRPLPRALADRHRAGTLGVTFADCIGLDEAIDNLNAAIVHPLRQGFAALKSWGLTPPTGVLITGPPGTGKTLLARAAAAESAANCIAVVCTELVSKVVGESERALSQLFVDARRSAPCIVLLDQIEVIGSPRASYASSNASSSSSSSDRLLSCLLTHLDGLTGQDQRNSNEDVIVIATTQSPAMLDPALLRAGRFDLHLQLSLPGLAARQAVLHRCFASIPVDAGVVDELVARLAACTAGFSTAMLIQLCHEAALATLREDLAAVSVRSEHLFEALSVVGHLRAADQLATPLKRPSPRKLLTVGRHESATSRRGGLSRRSPLKSRAASALTRARATLSPSSSSSLLAVPNDSDSDDDKATIKQLPFEVLTAADGEDFDALPPLAVCDDGGTVHELFDDLAVPDYARTEGDPFATDATRRRHEAGESVQCGTSPPW